jgi:hypothetical protein
VLTAWVFATGQLFFTNPRHGQAHSSRAEGRKTTLSRFAPGEKVPAGEDEPVILTRKLVAG